MRIVYWLTVAVAALVLASFAVSNRQMAALELWPLPFVAELPLYLLVLVAALAGFAVGGLAAWAGGHRARTEARLAARRIAPLERELSETRASPSRGDVPPIRT